jgi:putative PIN family toxin of toxin-antitoxin system
LKVVFDTNIFISAFVIPGSKAEEAYLHCLKGHFTLYPVRKPRHLWRGSREKCSFLVEDGVQSPALSNGVCSSVAILTETAQKLREKFGWQENKITRLLKAISKVATVIKTRPHFHVLDDDPDNRILECAIAVKADFIATGDKHLLSLKHFQNISILKLSDFLEVLTNDGC